MKTIISLLVVLFISTAVLAIGQDFEDLHVDHDSLIAELELYCPAESLGVIFDPVVITGGGDWEYKDWEYTHWACAIEVWDLPE